MHLNETSGPKNPSAAVAMVSQSREQRCGSGSVQSRSSVQGRRKEWGEATRKLSAVLDGRDHGSSEAAGKESPTSAKYFEGEGTPQNATEAVRLFPDRRQRGEVTACTSWHVYIGGTGVVTDPAQGAHWFCRPQHRGWRMLNTTLDDVF